jgi:hypothetical protein
VVPASEPEKKGRSNSGGGIGSVPPLMTGVATRGSDIGYGAPPTGAEWINRYQLVPQRLTSTTTVAHCACAAHLSHLPTRPRRSGLVNLRGEVIERAGAGQRHAAMTTNFASVSISM